MKKVRAGEAETLNKQVSENHSMTFGLPELLLGTFVKGTSVTSAKGKKIVNFVFLSSHL